MNIFMAWVIVGVCLYFINKGKRDKILGKYHLGKCFAVDMSKEFDEAVAKHHKDVADGVKTFNSLVEFILFSLTVLFSPYVLVLTVYRLFAGKYKQRYAKFVEKVNRFDEKYGDLGL